MKFASPFGTIVIELQESSISRIELGGNKPKDFNKGPERAELKQRLASELTRYFAGNRVSFSGYKLMLSGLPDFTRQVLQATRRIPYGKLRTYGDIAREIGRPKAARAVGQALKRNPIPLLIPCHRVVGVKGSLGGFSAGIKWKKGLLALEQGGIGD
jgi:methylated-DNA-[protein]-cysteine S-methyltransferase